MASGIIIETQTGFEELRAHLQVGAQRAGLLLICCGKVGPTQRHAFEGPAGNEHPDSHQGAGSACAGNARLAVMVVPLWASCRELSASQVACQ